MQHRHAFPMASTWPALGLGTWRMGEAARARAAEVAAVRLALEMGYRVIDTAEMYGEGGAEEVVGQALAEALRAGARAGATRCSSSARSTRTTPAAHGVRAACERSRRRLGLDRIDLYLLHWRGAARRWPRRSPASRRCVRQGQIRHWGVSNFDLRRHGGAGCACAGGGGLRGEPGLLLARRAWRRLRPAALAAAALDAADGLLPDRPGRLAGDAALAAVAERHGATAAQVALAWVLQQPGVMAIPKAVREAHLRENLAAADAAADAPRTCARSTGASRRRAPRQPLAMS